MTQLYARSRSPLLSESIVGASPSATYVIVRKKLEEKKTLTPFERHLATAWGWLEDTAVQSVQEGLVKPIQAAGRMAQDVSQVAQMATDLAFAPEGQERVGSALADIGLEAAEAVPPSMIPLGKTGLTAIAAPIMRTGERLLPKAATLAKAGSRESETLGQAWTKGKTAGGVSQGTAAVGAKADTEALPASIIGTDFGRAMHEALNAADALDDVSIGSLKWRKLIVARLMPLMEKTERSAVVEELRLIEKELAEYIGMLKRGGDAALRYREAVRQGLSPSIERLRGLRDVFKLLLSKPSS